MTTENQTPTNVSEASIRELSTQSGLSDLELRAEESMRGISEMIRLRDTRSPAILQLEEWRATINVLLAAALKTPPAGSVEPPPGILGQGSYGGLAFPHDAVFSSIAPPAGARDAVTDEMVQRYKNLFDAGEKEYLSNCRDDGSTTHLQKSIDYAISYCLERWGALTGKADSSQEDCSHG